MTKRITRAAAVALTLAGAAGAFPAQAGTAIRTATVPAGEIADAPTGFVEMCERDQSLCLAGHDATHPLLAAAPSVSLDITPAALKAVPRFEAPVLPAIVLPGYAPQATPWGVSLVTVNVTLGIADPVSPFPASVSLPRPVPAMEIATGAVDRVHAPKAVPAAAPALSAGNVQADIALLRKVNAVVNTYVRQIADIYTAGVAERWNRPGIGRNAAGDCEDLAIEKRMELVEAGFDPSRLAFAVVYKRNYGMHIVLIARTAKGDVVLDSLSPHVLRWDETKYSWLRIQSMDDPNRWHRVGPAPLPVPPMQMVTTEPGQTLS
ncbi:hypothetical protein SAMIE_1032140 [Sphingobium amiense]|uniref:Transglutaminase n=1 Tax=Sphingobium amiense TaxID=135719 RepID=A0A494W545_9SPHN|nr:transglutaminase-like cysteine peptidase [Sphingobium amiense]BBD99713.1 hypothetical protein SAMIE_1032140 [Sphingobium amiense]